MKRTSSVTWVKGIAEMFAVSYATKNDHTSRLRW